MQAAAAERLRIDLDADGENATALRWRSLGPTNATKMQNGVTLHVVDSGRVRKVLPRPDHPDQLFLLSAGGGLWKLEEFGQPDEKWKPITDFIGSTQGGSFAFGRGGRIHLGTGDPFDVGVGGFMVHSRGDDDKWSAPVVLPGATYVADVAVDDGPGREVVLAATDVGLFRSIDGGNSYFEVGHQLMGGKGVWSLVKTSAAWLATTEEMDPFGFVDGVGAIYFSTDRGATWRPIPGPIAGAGRMTLAVGAPQDRIVYAFAATTFDTRQLDLFRSSDGGLTWAPLGLAGKKPTNPTLFQSDMNILGGQAFYNQLLLVDPDDESRQTVYLGGQFASVRTRDGGATWTVISDWLANAFGSFPLPYVHADMHFGAVAHLKSGPVILFGTDGGLFTSNDGGDTWSDRANVGLVTHQLYALAGSSVHQEQELIGLQDNGVRSRVGTTSTFDGVLGGDGVGVAWSEADDAVSMAARPFGFMTASFSPPPDDQSKWRFASFGLDFLDTHFFVDPFAPTREAAAVWTPRTFFTSTLHAVWFTPNARRWFRIGIAGQAGLEPDIIFRPVPHGFGVAPFDGSRAGVVATRGRVALSTDPNSNDFFVKHLNDLVPGFASFTSSISWANDDVIYVSSVQPNPANVHLVKSTDDGLTWAAAEGGLPRVPVDIVRGDPHDKTGLTAYAGTWVGVYRTTDGGAHWKPFGRGLPQVRVRDFQIARDGSFLRTATYGRGVWEIELH
jgi:photosystem II stability/assembly factor-like uncharacterized protein